MLGTQLFVGNRGLLIENHPRHDHRADIGGDQIEIVGVGPGNAHRIVQHRAGPRPGRPGDDEKRQFEQSHRNRRALHPAVGSGHHDGDQHQGGKRQRDRARHAIHVPYPCHAGQFGQHRAGRGHQQAGDRHPGPEFAELLPNQFTVAAPCEYAEADRKFLNNIQNRHQHQLQQQQPVAPLHAALRRRDNAADIGVGKHDNQPWTENRKELRQPTRRFGGAERHVVASHS